MDTSTTHPLYLKQVMIKAPYTSFIDIREFLAGSLGTVVQESLGEWTDVDMGDDLVTARTTDVQEITRGSIVYRDHRGGLADAMATVTIVASLDELAAHLRPQLGLGDTTRDDIAFAPYGRDDRINWDTHIVTVKGNAVGFSNGVLA